MSSDRLTLYVRMATARREPTGERRAPLSRERVLRAAVALADEAGVDALSMRRIAKELGVEAMSLYNHVANKDDLLNGIVDLVFAEIEPPATDVDWKTAMRNRANSTREALRRHPWAIGLMEARSQPGPANIALHEAVIKCLREAGFSLPATVHAYSVQDAYIYGFALQENALPAALDTPEGGAEVAERQLRNAPEMAESFPYLLEMVGGHIATKGYDFAGEFAFGLDIILDGLERLRGATDAG
jgi:AcrR family transcriptional regulator